MTTLQWHSFGVAAKYTIGPWKFFGGYEYIDLANPNNPLVPGAWLPLTPQPDIDDVARRAKKRIASNGEKAKRAPLPQWLSGPSRKAAHSCQSRLQALRSIEPAEHISERAMLRKGARPRSVAGAGLSFR
jgi:hypothetical protein